MKKLIALFAVTIGFAATAQAGFILEPSVGFAKGTTTVTYTDANIDSASDDITMALLGLRVGFRHMGAWIGVDGDFGLSGKSKPSSGDSSDLTTSTAYVSLGYDFANRLRLWAGVGVMDSYVLKGDGYTTTYSGGTPLKLGVGYALTNHVSVNFQYMMHDFKKYKDDTTDELSIGDVGWNSLKNNSYALTLSFPMSW